MARPVLNPKQPGGELGRAPLTWLNVPRHPGEHGYVTAACPTESPLPRPMRRRDAALAKWRQAKAVDLAKSGHDYDAIAKEVGYSNRGTAWRVVQKALTQRIADGVDELRQVELDRLDRLLKAHWGKALAGDLPSAHVVLRTIEQRTRLLGLEDHEKGAVAGPVSIVRSTA